MKTKEISLDIFLSEQKPEKVVATLNYEDGLQLLESLVSSVEAGELSLEQSVNSYERGILLMNHLQGLLQGAEEKLKVLQLPKKAK